LIRLGAKLAQHAKTMVGLVAQPIVNSLLKEDYPVL